MSIKSFFCMCLFIMDSYCVFSQIDTSQMSFLISTALSEKDNMIVFYKKNNIPKVLKKSLSEKFEDNFRIANPNKSYQKTDVINNPFLPSRQMLFLIKNNNYYFFVFRQGGRGLSTYFVFSEILNNSINNMNIFNINNDIMTVEDFIQTIKLSKFYPIKW